MWALPLAAVAALVVIGINESAYREARDTVTLLGERGTARVQLQTLLRRLIDAETGQRGYLLTGRREYLEPYEQSVKDVEASLQWLAQYYGKPGETAAVLAAVAEITQRSHEKLSEVGTTIQLYDAGRTEAWRELLLTDIGREKMDTLRELADKLLAIESARVAEDRRGLFDTLQLNRIGVNLMTAVGLLALLMFLRSSAAYDAIQRQLATALQTERDRLEADVARRTADLTKLAKHLQTAREDERSRLARELHDELGALLTAAKLDTARLKRSLGTMSPEADVRLKHLNATINDGIGLKRRIIEDLRPSSLSNLGLVAALEIQAREFSQRAEIRVNTVLEHVTLSASCDITVFRLVQESLTNIAKYAGASVVTVSMEREDERAHVAVRDNGRGFDVLAQPGSAHGLLGMRYRVEAAGGVMRVESSPGQGTLVEAWLPALPEPMEDDPLQGRSEAEAVSPPVSPASPEVGSSAA
jgi:signal transduction histidine kinase